MTSGIYKIISPSNRIYIGQSFNIKDRFKVYKRLNCKLQIRLYESFIKYGVENHLFEILEHCHIINLNERERYYQDLFNVLGKGGLNCKLTNTNDRSGKFSDEMKNNLSKRRFTHKKKRIYSDEYMIVLKERMSNLRNSYSKERVVEMSKLRVGSKHTDETKAKMSLAHKGHIKTAIECERLSISNSNLILDTTTGIIFTGVIEASKAFNLNRRSLCNYLNGSRKNKTNLRYV